MLESNTGLNGFGGALSKEIYEDFDNGAAQTLINNVLYDMEDLLESRQFVELNNNLKRIVGEYSFSVKYVDYNEDINVTNEQLINFVIEGKRVEGLSERTLAVYKSSIEYLLRHVPKGIQEITAEDIKYFMKCKQEQGVSVVTINNYIRNFKAFFKYLTIHGLIFNNPLLSIHKIKEPVKVKKAFSNAEIVRLRFAFNKGSLRNQTIFELLLSSGMRIGELTGLKIDDVNLSNKTCIVLGKGNKERVCYFNETTKFLLEQYLDKRKDNSPYLFVSSKKPYNKLGINGIERIMRDAGKKSGVDGVHPHRFRRTFATNLLRKGVPIEQIKEYLGHEGITTTQLYAIIDESELKHKHKRLTD
jgi:site-specific recombinase XerD